MHTRRQATMDTDPLTVTFRTALVLASSRFSRA